MYRGYLQVTESYSSNGTFLLQLILCDRSVDVFTSSRRYKGLTFCHLTFSFDLDLAISVAWATGDTKLTTSICFSICFASISLRRLSFSPLPRYSVLGNPVLPNHRPYLTNADTICPGQKRRGPTFVVRSRTLLEYPSLLKCRAQFYSVSDFLSSYVLLHFFMSGFQGY